MTMFSETRFQVVCDANTSTGCLRGSQESAGESSARRYANEDGWTQHAGRDICPACTAAAPKPTPAPKPAKKRGGK
jgi:hypothetical protein